MFLSSCQILPPKLYTEQQLTETRNNKENNRSTWNYSKIKEQTKIKLYYPFALIILHKGME